MGYLEGEKHKGFQEKIFNEDGKRSVTMEVGGLALPLGRSFTMTWNMHIEA